MARYAAIIIVLLQYHVRINRTHLRNYAFDRYSTSSIHSKLCRTTQCTVQSDLYYGLHTRITDHTCDPVSRPWNPSFLLAYFASATLTFLCSFFCFFRTSERKHDRYFPFLTRVQSPWSCTEYIRRARGTTIHRITELPLATPIKTKSRRIKLKLLSLSCQDEICHRNESEEITHGWSNIRDGLMDSYTRSMEALRGYLFLAAT